MGEKTGIAWCDSTWNPWIGCSKVSSGCANCYAEHSTPARVKQVKWGAGNPRQLSSLATLKQPANWSKEPWVCDACGYFSDDRRTKGGLLYCAKCECFRHYHRRRVFSLSLGDWLDPEVDVKWLANLLEATRKYQGLDFLLLTKRPELFRDRICAVESLCAQHFMECGNLGGMLMGWLDGVIVPQNIWIGTTVEDQPRTQRIEHLLKIPARVRFLSCEPLLGPLDITNKGVKNGYSVPTATDGAGYGIEWTDPGNAYIGVDWVIVGGESGPKARPCNVEWIRGIKDQCQAAGVPCFVKQMGSNVHGDPRDGFTCDYPLPEFYRARLKHPKGGDPSEWPKNLRVQQFPKARD